MQKKAHTMSRGRNEGEHELRVAFRTSSVLTNPAIFDLVRHLARVAAENDYETLLKTGKIPYSDPKHRG